MYSILLHFTNKFSGTTISFYKFFSQGIVIFLYKCFTVFITRLKKHLKNEQRSRDAAAKKRANKSGVGKINNYCEDIYIPPYNNTH